MNTILRVLRFDVIEERRGGKFSFKKGIRNLLRNFNVLFSREILAGENDNFWITYKKEEKKIVIDDYSLVWKDGKPEFISTPKDNKENNAVICISQRIKYKK